MREPPVKKVLFWCHTCGVPLLGRNCACGAEGARVPLLKPYDVRPALQADRDLLNTLLSSRFGIRDIPRIVLFNKTGGLDRNDLVIAHGMRFGWLSFHPGEKTWAFVPEFEALPYLLPRAHDGILDLDSAYRGKEPITDRRIGGKRLKVHTSLPDGPVLLRFRGMAGTGTLSSGHVRIRRIGRVETRDFPDPGWETAVDRNRQHLKNLERHAIRFIRQHMQDRPCVNVSFSGGKDSTAVLELARRAGVTDAYFVDTGMEFPETLGFVEGMHVPVRLTGKGLLKAARERGPPTKDNRWCCELLKLKPVKEWLQEQGDCVTIQGNRWYESFSRAGLPSVCENPFHRGQLNISPIRNWRALEVFFYIWWRGLPVNPLYDMGFERVGCWMCPAMLESEFETVRIYHPDLYRQWIRFLTEHCAGKKLPSGYITSGLWRWETLPPKMRLLISQGPGER